MKLGDVINKDIFKELSVKKDVFFSIKELLRKYNLSYSKFNSIVSHLGLNLPSNIYTDLPVDLFNKINSSLENLNIKHDKTVNHKFNEENTDTKKEYITIKFGEHKGRKLRYVEDHFPEYIEDCKSKDNHWILEGEVYDPNTEFIKETKDFEEDVDTKEFANNLIITDVGGEKVIESNKIERKSNSYLERDEIKQIQEHYFRMPFSSFDLFKKLVTSKNIKIKNSELRSYFEEIINKKLP